MIRLFLMMFGFLAVLLATGLTVNVLIDLLEGVESSTLMDHLVIFLDDVLRKLLP